MRLAAIAFAIFALAAPLALLTGCDTAPAPEDAQLKAALAGTWFYQHRDARQQLVKGVLSQTEDGTFTLRKKVFATADPPEIKSAGSWYITAGLLKLFTSEVDGKKYGTLKLSYFTCRVTRWSSKDFSCTNDVTQKTFEYKKVGADFDLS